MMIDGCKSRLCFLLCTSWAGIEMKINYNTANLDC